MNSTYEDWKTNFGKEGLPVVYLVIGCPGAGKSWICDQLKDHFTYVHHDLYIGMSGDAYLKAIADAGKSSKKALLTEAPFSVSQTKKPLEEMGFKVIPVVIEENPLIIAARYLEREKKSIPAGHLSRQNTYSKRAKESGWFCGTSSECLKHLLEYARR